MLLLAEGETWAAIRDQLNCGDLINRSLRAKRLAGFYSLYAGKAPEKRRPRIEARILDVTRQVLKDGATHWSTRKLAAVPDTSHIMVAQIWAKHGLKPHRIERYLPPPSRRKRPTSLIDLHLNPSACAAVFRLPKRFLDPPSVCRRDHQLHPYTDRVRFESRFRFAS